MPEGSVRHRGWYLDPRDPTRVRHWDGDRWQRARTRPTWNVSWGDLVVDVDGRFDTSQQWAGPTVEGPARPAPQRATTGALGVGAEARPGRTQPARLAGGVPGNGLRAGRIAPPGPDGRPATSGPWSAARRPILILTVVVALALGALAISVGWSKARTLVPTAIPSAFVARASQACATSLGTKRPTTLPSTAGAMRAESHQISALAGSLRRLAAETGADQQVSGWLDDWQRFSADEEARATASASGAASQIGSAPQDTTVGWTQRSLGEETSADNFAVANDLQTCTLLVHGPAQMTAIPS